VPVEIIRSLIVETYFWQRIKQLLCIWNAAKLSTRLIAG